MCILHMLHIIKVGRMHKLFERVTKTKSTIIKEKKMKRIISLLLVASFVLFAFVACGGKNEETEPPKASGSGEITDDKYGQEGFVSAVPVGELDFDGKELVLYIQKSEDKCREWYRDDDSSDELDEAIRTRNSVILSDLNVSLRMDTYNAISNWDENNNVFNQSVVDDVGSGLAAYDFVAQYQYVSTYPILRDAKANLLEKEIFPYFDFSLPCWNQDIVNLTSKYGKLYNVAGDVNLALFNATFLIWLNKELYSQKRTEDDPLDLQDVALDYEWYAEDFYDWAELYETSSNNEHACQNLYGISMRNKVVYYALPLAYEFDFILENNDGTHTFNVKNNEKAEGVLTDFRGLKEKDGFAGYDEASCTCTVGGEVKHFANGNSLFLAHQLYTSKEDNAAIREMEDEYCILPLPLYDENQTDYHTSADYGFNMVYVLNHSDISDDGIAISAYLQYVNELSYTNVRGYYIEGIVKPKFLGSDDTNGTVTKSIRTFNIITKSLEFGIVGIYSAQINDIGWLWMDNITKGTQSLTAAFEKNNISGPGSPTRTEAQYIQLLEEFDSWLMD